MRDRLQQCYQVHKEVSRSGYYEGIIEAGSLPRLNEFLSSNESIIRLRFEIDQSEFDVPRIKGQFETALLVECQRCLNNMEVQLQQEFELLVDAPDELLRESSLDTVYSENGTIDIFEIMEDELILSLPLVPMHADTACNEQWSNAELKPRDAKEENPFLVLKKLKTSS